MIENIGIDLYYFNHCRFQGDIHMSVLKSSSVSNDRIAECW
jgi:hypothetical protein